MRMHALPHDCRRSLCGASIACVDCQVQYQRGEDPGLDLHTDDSDVRKASRGSTFTDHYGSLATKIANDPGPHLSGLRVGYDPIAKLRVADLQSPDTFCFAVCGVWQVTFNVCLGDCPRSMQDWSFASTPHPYDFDTDLHARHPPSFAHAMPMPMPLSMPFPLQLRFLN